MKSIPKWHKIKKQVLEEAKGIGDIRGEIFEDEWNEEIIDLTLAKVEEVLMNLNTDVLNDCEIGYVISKIRGDEE